MTTVSIFVDESGEQGFQSKYYAVTLVFHDQSNPVLPSFTKYERVLRDAGLPDIPLHASPLLNGHDDYELLTVSERKRLLSHFLIMSQSLPIQYMMFFYRKSDFSSLSHLETRLKRDLVNALFERLDYLHRFDTVKLYYDGGQGLITNSLHTAIEYVLSKQAIVYRQGSPLEYRLAQVADFFCTIELTAQKYQLHEQTATDERFFGAYGSFKKNFLKKIRKHVLLS